MSLSMYVISVLDNERTTHVRYMYSTFVVENGYTICTSIRSALKVGFHYPSSRPEFTGRQLDP